MKRFLRALVMGVALLAPAVHAQSQAQPPAQGQTGQAARDEYVPVSELPPTAEQLPAAPLVITAYALMWLATLVYVWTIWRRLGAVEQEIGALRRDIAAKG